MTKEDKEKLFIAIRQMSLKQKIVAMPFLLCAIFLLLLGKSLNLSYKQISVVINLWFQGALLVISSILPLCGCLIKMSHRIEINLIILCLFFLIYVLIYVWAFIGMCNHYGKDMDYAFDLCVCDLKHIAQSWRMSYHAANLLIFVLIFCVIIAINIMLLQYVLA